MKSIKKENTVTTVPAIEDENVNFVLGVKGTYLHQKSRWQKVTETCMILMPNKLIPVTITEWCMVVGKSLDAIKCSAGQSFIIQVEMKLTFSSQSKAKVPWKRQSAGIDLELSVSLLPV